VTFSPGTAGLSNMQLQRFQRSLAELFETKQDLYKQGSVT